MLACLPFPACQVWISRLTVVWLLERRRRRRRLKMELKLPSGNFIVRQKNKDFTRLVNQAYMR